MLGFENQHVTSWPFNGLLAAVRLKTLQNRVIFDAGDRQAAERLRWVAAEFSHQGLHPLHAVRARHLDVDQTLLVETILFIQAVHVLPQRLALRLNLCRQLGHQHASHHAVFIPSVLAHQIAVRLFGAVDEVTRPFFVHHTADPLKAH